MSYSIDRNGLKSVLRTWKDEAVKDLEILEIESRKYLRFEYEQEAKKEWLHVVKNGEEWY